MPRRIASLFHPDRRRMLVPCILAAVLGGGAFASGAIPGTGSGVISGCYSTSDGALRVIDQEAGESCTEDEKALQWHDRGLRWRGNYLSSVNYAPYDAVAYRGGSYIVSGTDPAAGVPPTNTASWKTLAAPGAPGVPGHTWKGAWSATAQYAVGDAVSHGGASYRARLKPAVGTAPVPGGSPTWSVMAAKGDKGERGPQGPAAFALNFDKPFGNQHAFLLNDEVRIYISCFSADPQTSGELTVQAIGRTGAEQLIVNRTYMEKENDGAPQPIMKASVDQAAMVLSSSVVRDGRTKTAGGTATIKSATGVWTVTFNSFVHQGGCQLHGSVTPTA